MCKLPAHMLYDSCINHFLLCLLPRCVCLVGALRTPMERHAALMPVLEFVRARGVTAGADGSGAFVDPAGDLAWPGATTLS